MIKMEDLIQDKILYSLSWPEGMVTHYLYVTQKKIYLYNYMSGVPCYTYDTYVLDKIGSVSMRPYGKQSYEIVFDKGAAKLTFPYSGDGQLMAEKTYVAITRILGGANEKGM